jgi:hypothetical protein
MIVNIEKAEEIVNCGGITSKKSSITQKRLLHQVIQQVEHRRKLIQEYVQTVNIISRQYDRKQQSLEQFIHQLHDREQSLDEGLLKINVQQKELERRQVRIEHDLQTMRQIAEKCREKKLRCEQYYHAVASVPLLSAQSKKRYIKARDKNAEAEQQLSEVRQALDKCKTHLKLVSKTVSAQYSEQDLLSNQRRGSVDTIITSKQQLDYLRQGSEFWSGFDSYQAQVVLESAIYLLDPNQPKQKDSALDMDQVWIKTFKLACFEYGDRELYGDMCWNPKSLQINFNCDLCQTSQVGWPNVIRDQELACELCYNTTLDHDKCPIMTPSMVDIPSYQNNYSKMQKLFSALFNYHPKVNPL